ncbi:MAG: phage tail tape measure protein, partial [Candidatus Paceibacterota bacterium]
MEVGVLSARMTMDVSALQAAQASMVAFEKQATRSLNTVAQRIRTFGYLATAVITVPMVAAAKSTAKMASEFEFTMQKIVGLAGVAQSAIGGLSKEIKQLAPAVGKGPKELAEALYFIESSGIKGAASMDVLKLSAKGAATGLGETQDIANLLTSVLSAYKGTGMTAAYATDILVAAVREGKAEASQFAGSIGQLIPIAANLGVSFDQVAGGMAAITLNGASAANSAVYLKGIFNALNRASEKGDTALSKYNSSYIKLREILRTQGVISLLEEVNHLMGEAEKRSKGKGEEFLSDVFPNVRALTGVLSLAGKNFEYNTELMKRVTESAGSLGDAFAAVSDTIKLRYDKAIARIQVSQITLGTSIANTFIPILEKLASFVERLTAWWENLSEAQQRHKLIIAGVVAALGPLSLVLSAIIYSVSGLATAFKLLATVILGPLMKGLVTLVNYASAAMATSLGMAGAIGIVIVAVAGLAYAIYQLVNSKKQLNQEDLETVRINQIIADTEAEAARKIESEVAQLEVLKEAITSANIPTEVRAKLIQELNNRFGTYMTNLLNEKATNEEVKKAIDEINTSLVERIDLETKLASAGKLGEEKADVVRKQLDIIRKRAEKMKEMKDLQEKINASEGGGKLSKWGGVGLDEASQLQRSYNAAEVAVKGYNAELEVTRKDLLNIEEKIKGIAQLPGVGTVLKGGTGGGDKIVISYYNELTTNIEEAEKSLKALSKEQALGAKGAKLRSNIEGWEKQRQAIMGSAKATKELAKDEKDLYNTRAQLAENSVKRMLISEEELANRMAWIRIQTKKDEIEAEKDSSKKALLKAELEGMVLDETDRQRKVAVKRLEEQYAREAELAKLNAETTIQNDEELAKKVEKIEIDLAQRILDVRKTVLGEDTTQAQALLDIRKQRNSDEYREEVFHLKRMEGEWETSYEGRLALIEKEYHEGVIKSVKEKQEKLRQVEVEFYDFKKVSAQANLDFL